MGQKHSLQDDLITFKLTSKELLRSSKKCESNMAAQKVKLKEAITKGNKEAARIYGENAVREKNQALNFLRMASRIDGVASRVESAIRMQSISSTMGTTVQSMSEAMKSMDYKTISNTMDAFEKQFEDLDAVSKTMEERMGAATAMDTPVDDVDALISQTAEEFGLQSSLAVMNASVPGTASAQAQPAVSDDLETRLAALRK